MTRSQWLSQFPRQRREDLQLAISYAVFAGRDTIAKYVAGRGGVWAEGRSL